MTLAFVFIGVCTVTSGFFKIIDRIERPRKFKIKENLQ